MREDVSIVALELQLDRSRRRFPSGGAPVLGLCAVLAAIVVVPLIASSARRASAVDVDLPTMERSIRAHLAGELLGRLLVRRVACRNGSASEAHCAVVLYDRSGAGPIRQAVTVRVDPATGRMAWRMR